LQGEVLPADRSWPKERSGFVARLILKHSVTRRAAPVKLRSQNAPQNAVADSGTTGRFG
jgi:hypothetical protein